MPLFVVGHICFLTRDILPPGVRAVEKPDLRPGATWVFYDPGSGAKETKIIKTIKDGLVYVVENNNCHLESLTYTLEWGAVDDCGFIGPNRRGRIILNPPRQNMPFPAWPGKPGLYNL